MLPRTQSAHRCRFASPERAKSPRCWYQMIGKSCVYNPQLTHVRQLKTKKPPEGGLFARVGIDQEPTTMVGFVPSNPANGLFGTAPNKKLAGTRSLAVNVML